MYALNRMKFFIILLPFHDTLIFVEKNSSMHICTPIKKLVVRILELVESTTPFGNAKRLRKFILEKYKLVW